MAAPTAVFCMYQSAYQLLRPPSGTTVIMASECRAGAAAASSTLPPPPWRKYVTGHRRSGSPAYPLGKKIRIRCGPATFGVVTVIVKSVLERTSVPSAT